MTRTDEKTDDLNPLKVSYISFDGWKSSFSCNI